MRFRLVKMKGVLGMHSVMDIFTKEKIIPLNTVEDMVKFALGGFGQEDKKPNDIEPYIDFEKGWKFTEDGKDFLIAYYEDWIQGCIECADGDFIEEATEVLNSIKENGVEASKDLIQASARFEAECVCDDIYNYYKDSPTTLKFIENSIIDVRW